MPKRIQPVEASLPPIRDAGVCLPRVEPDLVREALEAEDCVGHLAETLSPVTLFAVRQELVNRLQSSGGRPALSGITRRAKIPLSDQEWLQLEELAAAVSAPGFAPSAGQVASVLLTLSLQALRERTSSEQSHSSMVNELAEWVAAEPARNGG